MKLAEALIDRAALQKKLKELRERIDNSVRVEEGDTPVEEVGELATEFWRTNEELSSLIVRINQTNASADSGHAGLTITALIEERDKAARIKNLYDSLASVKAAEARGYGFRTKDEVKYVLTYNPRDYREKLDTLAKSIREMDAKLQAANWTTELL